MEQKYVVAVDGVEVNLDDIEVIAESAHIDDKLLSTLIRMPFGWSGTVVSKCIIPYEPYSVDSNTNTPRSLSDLELVTPAFDAGPGEWELHVYPFRAVISSRTPAATDAELAFKDLRSAVHVGNTTSGYTRVFPDSNGSSDPRIDLIYMSITPDADEASVIRKVKDVDSGVITSASVVTYKNTTIVIGKVNGTAGASPSPPSIPADTSTVFYIPLAYLRIPGSWDPTVEIEPTDITFIAPFLPIARPTGVCEIRPAGSNSIIGGGGRYNTTAIANWGATGTKYPNHIPPTAVGEEVLWIAIDMTDGTSANWSHAYKAIVDNSRDWRYRMFKWEASGSTGQFAWEPGASAGTMIPRATTSLLDGTGFGWGQAWTVDASGIETDAMLVANLVGDTGNSMPVIGAGKILALYTRQSDGALRVWTTGAAAVDGQVIIRLTASAPFNRS